jgi:hypothetical protein
MKIQRSYWLEPKVAYTIKLAAVERGVSASALITSAVATYLGEGHMEHTLRVGWPGTEFAPVHHWTDDDEASIAKVEEVFALLKGSGSWLFITVGKNGAPDIIAEFDPSRPEILAVRKVYE